MTCICRKRWNKNIYRIKRASCYPRIKRETIMLKNLLNISSCNLFKDEPCYKCEDDWKEHGGNCYYFSTNSSSWNESRTVCKSKGGDLVKIDSEEEQV
uniref:C-type lectin domain-containing protein n=1 Tax=Oreochromis aureus TaxID=47969 RepID=A0AAZ1XRC3_OREAU